MIVRFLLIFGIAFGLSLPTQIQLDSDAKIQREVHVQSAVVIPSHSLRIFSRDYPPIFTFLVDSRQLPLGFSSGYGLLARTVDTLRLWQRPLHLVLRILII